MKKVTKYLFVCILAAIAVVAFPQAKVMAAITEYSTSIGLGGSNDSEDFGFTMPKDGKVRIDAKLRNNDTVPGSLTIIIQKGYSENAVTIKEITGITENAPLENLELDLKKGEYDIVYKVTSETGDLSNTSIFFTCTQKILPTVPQNISELTVNTVNTFEDITNKGYDVLKFGDDKEVTDLVIPFTVKKGSGVYISLGPDKKSFELIEGTVFKDKECTAPVGKSFTLEDGLEYNDYIRTLTGAGTYYIKFTLENMDYKPVGETPFLVKLYELDGTDRVLTLGKTNISYQDKNSKKINYKITVKANSSVGFMITPFDNSKGGYASFSLLDKNKKVVIKSSKAYTRTEDTGKYGDIEKVYTVPAGTYYVQVNCSDNLYQLETIYLKGATNAGSSKAKAKTLKIMDTTGKGYLTCLDKISSVDWFKFTVKSDQYVELYLQYLLDGNFDFEVLDSKGKVLYKNSKNLGVNQGNVDLWYGQEYSKGTYYIKVYKKGTSSSVAYNLTLLNYHYESE